MPRADHNNDDATKPLPSLSAWIKSAKQLGLNVPLLQSQRNLSKQLAEKLRQAGPRLSFNRNNRCLVRSSFQRSVIELPFFSVQWKPARESEILVYYHHSSLQPPCPRRAISRCFVMICAQLNHTIETEENVGGGPVEMLQRVTQLSSTSSVFINLEFFLTVRIKHTSEFPGALFPTRAARRLAGSSEDPKEHMDDWSIMAQPMQAAGSKRSYDVRSKDPPVVHQLAGIQGDGPARGRRPDQSRYHPRLASYPR